MHGSMSVCGVADDDDGHSATGLSPADGVSAAVAAPAPPSVSFFTGDSLGDVWGQFVATPDSPPTLTDADAAYGAMAVATTLAPGETKTLSLVLAW